VTALLELRADALLDRFASSDPTPGGGSGAALGGALGAALVAMVCALPRTRTGAPDERARLDTALRWAAEAGQRLRSLVDDDARAYDAVSAAYRLPKKTEAEVAARRAAVAAAMARATEVPLLTLDACLVVLQAAQEAAAHGNPNALSDARTGAALAWAGLYGAAENVRTNAPSLGVPAGELLEKVDAALGKGRDHAAAMGVPVG
jgi:methenyltetrahydrofolate cyclohydrolase